eukprot:sb/3468992/
MSLFTRLLSCNAAEASLIPSAAESFQLAHSCLIHRWSTGDAILESHDNSGLGYHVIYSFVRGTIGGIYLSVPEEAGVGEVELFIRDIVLRDEMKDQCSKFFIFFSCQCEPHNTLILEIVLETLDTLRRTPTMSPYMAPSLARPGMSLPVGYTLAPLQLSHVDHIVHHWKEGEGKEGRSETQLRIMATSGIKERPSVGIFEDGKTDLLVAWCLMYQAGGLGPIWYRRHLTLCLEVSDPLTKFS